MKKCFKKIMSLILLIMMLFTSTPINVILAADWEEVSQISGDTIITYNSNVVNLDVALEITQESENDIYTGEVHKLIVSASYANPNFRSKHIRIYLKNSDGTANTDIVLNNFVDGKLAIATNVNEMNLFAEVKQDETGRYIEYELFSGASIEMELELLFPNGNGALENEVVIHPEVFDDEIKDEANSDKLTDKVLVSKSRFGWENLQNTASVEQLYIDSAINSFSGDVLEYGFSANNIYKTESVGTTLTKKVTFEDQITLPDGINFGEISQVGNTLVNSEGNTIVEVLTNSELAVEEGTTIGTLENVNFEVNGSTVVITGDIVNDSEVNGNFIEELAGIEPLIIKVNVNNLDLTASEYYHVIENIENTISCDFISVKDTVVSLNANKDVSIAKDKGSLSIVKKNIYGSVITTSTTKFELYNKAGEKVLVTKSNDGVYVVSTDGTGETVLETNLSTARIQIDNLLTGEYTLREIEAPNGYELLDEDIEISVAKGSNSVEVVNQFGNPDIIVSKVDTFNNIITNSAMFNLYDEEGNLVKFNSINEGTDGKDYIYSEGGSEMLVTYAGKINLYGLADGTYKLKEVVAPEGYVLNSQVAEIVLDGGIAEVSVTNRSIYYANVVIEKVDENGTLITTGGATFEVYDSNDNKLNTVTTTNGRVTIDQLPEGEYYLKEITAPEGYRILNEITNFEIATPEDVTVVVRNERIPYGVLNLTKTDELGNIITSDYARFNIYDLEDNFIQTIQTANGVASVRLEVGEYYLIETLAPDGYRKSTEEISFTLADGQETEISVENERIHYGTLNLNKIDQFGDTIEDSAAYFDLYNAEDGSFYKQIITEDGWAIERLEEGEYYLIETRAPEGHRITTTESIEVIITDGENTDISVENELIQYGTLRLNKVDENNTLIDKKENYKDDEGNNTTVNGKADMYAAKFELYKEGNDEPLKVLTTEEGIAIEEDLEIGNYYVKEISAPFGYTIISEITDFEITADEIIDVYVQNEKQKEGTLRIKKVDQDGNPLAGARFSIKQNGITVKTGMTDSNGILEVVLPVGDYSYTETQTPVGYEGTASSQFTITEGCLVEKEETNRLIPKEYADVRIRKVDDEGNLITTDFATFSINGTSTIDTVNGIALTQQYLVDKNNPTTLTIKETKAPEGYAPSTKTETVTLSSAGTKEVTFVNMPYKELIIKKVDDEGNIITTGNADFEVTIKDKEATEELEAIEGSVNTYTTVDGVVVVPNLFEGMEIEVKETRAPSGYLLDGETQTITISKDEEENVLEFTNIPLRTVTITKVDDNGNIITDDSASFNVSMNNTTTSYTTINGIVIIENVPVGTVINIQETRAPRGYVLDSITRTLTVEKNSTNNINITNRKTKDVTIAKIDENGYLITESNAAFTIYSTTENKYATFEEGTNDTYLFTQFSSSSSRYYTEDGLLKLSRLPAGYYRCEEVESPEYYNSSYYTYFTVEANGSIRTVESNPVAIEGKEISPEPTTDLDIVKVRNYGYGWIDVTLVDEDGDRITSYNGSISINGSIRTVTYGNYEDNENVGTYTVKEVSAPYGYALNTNEYTDVVTLGNTTYYTIPHTRLPNGTLKLNKVDENGQLITASEATFDIYTSDGQVLVANNVSTTNGVLTRTLAIGDYYAVEKDAPDGYLVSDEHIEFTITEATTTEISATNELTPYGYVKLSKINTNNNLILNDTAQFKIYDSENNLVEFEDYESYKGLNIHFDSSFNLESDSYDWIEIYYKKDGNTYRYTDNGTYKFSRNALANKNIYIPSFDIYIYLRTDGSVRNYGFEVDSISLHDEEISRNDPMISLPTEVRETIEYKGENYPKTNHEHEDNMRTLYHYQKVYNESNDDSVRIINTLTTANGVLYLSLEPGQYTIEEVKAPNGYELAEERATIEVTNENYYNALETNIVNQYREYGKLEIHKKDSYTSSLINDTAKFNLLDSSNNALALKFVESTSNGNVYELSNNVSENTVTDLETYNGKIILNEIPWGNYQIHEIESPDGYLLNTTDTSVSIGVDQLFSPIVKTITNAASTGNVEIQKVNPSGNVITDGTAKFNLYDSNNNLVKFVNEDGEYTYTQGDGVTEISTTAGIINIKDLPVGTYSLVETEAPEHYEPINESTEIEVTSANRYNTLEKTIENKYKEIGKLTIYKKDKNTGNVITNVAKFNLIDSSDNVIALKFVETTEEGNVYELSNNASENTVTDLETYNGIIKVNGIVWGDYEVAEVEAPMDYAANEENDTVTIGEEHIYDPLVKTIYNAPAIGNIQLKKVNEENELITEDSAIFKMYDEEGNLVKFNNIDGDYEYTSNGAVTFVYTTNGLANINKLPLGTYKLEEVSAPLGYVVNKEQIEIIIEEADYYSAKMLSIQNAKAKFGIDNAGSVSWIKVEEIGNAENNTKGYLENNKIAVQNESEQVKYTLNVTNMSIKNFEDLVLINKLPAVGDIGNINLNETRNSRYDINLDTEEFNAYIISEDGTKELIPEAEYQVSYTDKLQYTEDDWSGAGEDWNTEFNNSSKAFRIKFNNLKIATNTSVEIEYVANISSDATPGKVAWNTFGYRYSIGNSTLMPEPAKVGVEIENEYITKTITKQWVDEELKTRRPESVILQLKAGDVVVAEQEISSVNDEEIVSFENLPKYDEFGEEIVYTAAEVEKNEDDLKWYTTEIDNTNLIVRNVLKDIDTSVLVHHYIDGTTTSVSEDVLIEGYVEDPYETEVATDIDEKYEYVVEKAPTNANGTMTKEQIVVIYYYKVKDTTLTVKYLEKGTNIPLETEDHSTGKVDDDYTTQPKDIENYTLVEDSGNTSGKLTVEPTTVIYYYSQNTTVRVQHIDKTTGELLDESVTPGLVGDEFTSTSKDFDGYILIEVPEEETVTLTKDEIVLKYYYVKISGGVIEKHIDIHTGEILANASYEGNVGDPYDIPSRTFEGYELVEDRLPTNNKGTMTELPQEVIYYYTYKTKVTVEYIDKITGEKLTPDEVQEGHEKDSYTTERKEFEGYDLIEVPENADGEMTKEPIVVTYYYIHQSAGVIENHYDVETGEKLTEETTYTGHEGDDYKTTSKEFNGYDLVEERYPSNAEGKMTVEVIRVDYYYKKRTSVIVKHVDKVTGEELADQEILSGNKGNPYETEEKEIPGYDLVEIPENAKGEMTDELIEVIYYYVRPAKVIVNHIDIDTNKLLADEEIIEGHQDDPYTTSSKEFEYYKLVEEKLPTNAEGKMVVEVVTDEAGNKIINDTIFVNYYYKKMIFNLKVDKTISSIIINGEEKAINKDFGKVEINRQNIATTNIKVVYTITVTNDSELSGKGRLIENIPTGMVMRQEKNTAWDVSETVAKLETEELKPGESKEYKVTLDWLGGDGNVGTKTNIVEITGSENEAGFEESSKADNKDNADIVIVVGTGEYTYIVGVGIVLIALAGIAVALQIKKRREE